MDAIDAACDALEEMRRPELAASIRIVRYVADNPDAVLWDLVFEAAEILETAGLPGVAEIAGLLERRSLLLPTRNYTLCPFCGGTDELAAIRDLSVLSPWSIRCGVVWG